MIQMARKDISNRQVCEAYWKYNATLSKPMPIDILQAETGEPAKVCLRAMQRAYDAGYIECGTSLATGWLTEKGEELLGDHSISEHNAIKPGDTLEVLCGDRLIKWCWT